MIEVGDTFTWAPTAFTNHGEDSSGVLGSVVEVHGRVILVHREHGWFRVEAQFPGGVIRECFKLQEQQSQAMRGGDRRERPYQAGERLVRPQ